MKRKAIFLPITFSASIAKHLPHEDPRLRVTRDRKRPHTIRHPSCGPAKKDAALSSHQKETSCHTQTQRM